MLWEGDRVRLRAIEPDDLEAFAAHDRDSDAARSVDHVYPPRSDAAARRWIEGETQATPDGDELRLVIEAGGEVVGSVNTHTCNARVGTFSYGVGVFGWQQRQGFAREAVVILLRYMFGERRYQKCTVSVADFNQASLALHRSLGFVEEGRIRRSGYGAGRFWDSVVVGITAEEFAARWGY